MQESRSAVETGMGETAHARRSLEAIIESSKQVEHQIHLIATAATEQTSASGEISESAGQISQLSTETAQGAEEAVEALKNLASLASDLDGMIRQFRLDGGNPAASPAEPACVQRPAVRQPAWVGTHPPKTASLSPPLPDLVPAAFFLNLPNPRIPFAVRRDSLRVWVFAARGSTPGGLRGIEPPHWSLGETLA
jgi:hypothetical protein